MIFTRNVRKPRERYLKHFVPQVDSSNTDYTFFDAFIENTSGDEIIEELIPLPSEHVIDKKRRSAFLFTSLVSYPEVVGKDVPDRYRNRNSWLR